MKIVVLIKTAKFVYAQTGTEIKKNYIGPDDILPIVNPLDEMALEYALELRDRDERVKVCLLTLGDRFAEEGLRRGLAMGADEAVHIRYGEYEKLDQATTSAVLAPACERENFDLILCGATAIDDNAGLVGPYVAERLAVPHISRVVQIATCSDGRGLEVHRAVERGDRQVLECSLPALLTIHRGTTVPRYPTLSGFLRANAHPITVLEPESLLRIGKTPLSSMNLTETTGHSNPKPKKKKETPQKSKLSAAQRLRSIMKREPAKEKEGGKIIEGTSQEMFTRVDGILKEAGVLTE